MRLISGLVFTVEGTGGGCEALVNYCGGQVIVVTDGNLSVDLWADHADCNAALFDVQDWTDGGEPVVSVDSRHNLSPAEMVHVLSLVRDDRLSLSAALALVSA